MGISALAGVGIFLEPLPRPPVHRRHHGLALGTLRQAIAELTLLEQHLQARPDDTTTFAAISDQAGDLLMRTQEHVVTLWHVRDCEGEG